jgi:hypothetical protein
MMKRYEKFDVGSDKIFFSVGYFMERMHKITGFFTQAKLNYF